MRRATPILVGAFVGALALPANAQSSDHVRVHVVSEDDVFLQRMENRKWVDVCWSPCDSIVDADGRYRIEGPGVRPTSPFSLYATSLEGSETIQVDASHDAARDAGFVLVGVGAAGLLAGVLIVWVGEVSEKCEGTLSIPGSTQCGPAYPTLFGIGIGTFVSAALVGGIGALVAIRSSHSSVGQMASTSPKPNVRFFASQTAHRSEGGPSTEGRVADPASILVPIVSVSF